MHIFLLTFACSLPRHAFDLLVTCLLLTFIPTILDLHICTCICVTCVCRFSEALGTTSNPSVAFSPPHACSPNIPQLSRFVDCRIQYSRIRWLWTHNAVENCSVGQQKRIGLARLSMMQRNIWLLDEPTTNLDIEGKEKFLELHASHLKSGGLSIITSHEPAQFNKNKIINLDKHRIY